MILSFIQDRFIDRIKEGIKFQSMREDRHNRWQPGRKIHFWRRNPRNVHLNPRQFGIGVCSEIKYVTVLKNYNLIIIGNGDIYPHYTVISGIKELNDFAILDGFDNWDDFKRFFPAIFIGKIIYWNHKLCIFES